MDCINPDGSLTPSARAICESLIQPGSLEDISRNTSLPVHRLRPYLQELLAAGLVVDSQGSYCITDIGLALLFA